MISATPVVMDRSKQMCMLYYTCPKRKRVFKAIFFPLLTRLTTEDDRMEGSGVLCPFALAALALETSHLLIRRTRNGMHVL